MPAPPNFSALNPYVASFFPDLRTPKSPRRFFPFSREATSVPSLSTSQSTLPTTTTLPSPPPPPVQPIPSSHNPQPSTLPPMPLSQISPSIPEKGPQHHNRVSHTPSSSLSSISNQLGTGATIVRTPQEALAGLRQPPATALTTKFHGHYDQFNEAEDFDQRSQNQATKIGVAILPTLRKQASTGSISTSAQSHSQPKTPAGSLSRRQRDSRPPALPEISRISTMLTTVPEGLPTADVYPPQVHLGYHNFQQPQPQQQQSAQPRPPLPERQDSTRSEAHPTLPNKIVVINERTGRRVTRDRHETRTSKEKEVREHREAKERPVRPPLPAGPPPQLPPGAKPARHSLLAASSSQSVLATPSDSILDAPSFNSTFDPPTSQSIFDEDSSHNVPAILSSPLTTAAFKALLESQDSADIFPTLIEEARVAPYRSNSTCSQPQQRSGQLPPLFETPVQVTVPPGSPLMRSASHPHMTSTCPVTPLRRHPTNTGDHYSPREPAHTATMTGFASSTPSSTSASSTPAANPILLSHSVRLSPNSISTTMVTLKFGFSLDELPDTTSVTLPLDLMRPAGGRLVAFLDDCLEHRDGSGDGEGPGMTDGSSADESDLETEEYGLNALLRDEYMSTFGFTSPSIDCHTVLSPRSQPFPRATGVITSNEIPPRTPRAATRNQYTSQSLYPSPSSPTRPPSPVAIHARRGLSSLTLQEVVGSGRIVHLTVWIPRNASPWHVIAARLGGGGGWRGLGVGAGVAGGVMSPSARETRSKVEEELAWAGMTVLSEELKPKRKSRVYI